MLDKVYKHDKVEKYWYLFWEKKGYFTPKIDKRKRPFTIILPPPNANADLHLGHAMYTVEDILIRYHRMKGKAALWLPGADHAGFETQYVFEKKLIKEGKNRFNYSRETLYQMIWDFVQKNRGNMENQLRRLGFSLDWTRQVFTLDPEIIKIVYKTFKKLYDEGLIYRSERLVNYCTRCGTGFSDLEVNHLETIDNLYYIKYPFKDGSGNITVATTRPETMFGDVAIAIHPKDERYKKYVGKIVLIPLSNFPIPIIEDDSVDMKFGTGAVKITPAHDENDYEIGKRHNLETIQVIGFDGKIMKKNVVPKQYWSLNVKEAREKILSDLSKKEIKLLDHVNEKHKLVKNICYKCGRVIEPLPLPQWYIKIRPLAEEAIKAIKNKRIAFIPERFENLALQWLNNFHDWNISRQIVWGIRIPAWLCSKCGRWSVTDGKKPLNCPNCNGDKLEQDTDVFDTWFSSGQWPFATLKVTNAGDFNYFYPTSVMETGYDILPWWVCRMIMLGIYMTGKVPFKNVCLHGLVRDAKGQKMSKSRGNVISPISMVELYGADALRMALIFGTAFGNDIPISEDKIRSMRNFGNKIWNIGRFIKMTMENYKEKKISLSKIGIKENIKQLNFADKKILSQLGMLERRVTKSLDNYQFDKAANALYEFIWHSFADKYIEEIKTRLKQGDNIALSTLTYVYKICLQLLHPFMPFITEELNRQIFGEKEKPIIISSWPKV